MTKEQTKTVENEPRFTRAKGILMLAVVTSVIYLAVTVFFGTDDLFSKVMTAPAIIWAGAILVARFAK